MKNFLSLLVGVAIGFASAVVVLSPAAGPPRVHTVKYANGQVQLECPLDSQGRMHGEMRMYHPSGRLKTVTHYSHGQIGSGESYRDDMPDSSIEDTE